MAGVAESSVETLRAAAARLRELAKETTPGPWEVKTDLCDCGGDYGCRHGTYPYAFGPFSYFDHGGEKEHADVDWIALVHPGIAEPLAYWLEGAALAAEEIGPDHRAVEFARVLLGVPDGR